MKVLLSWLRDYIDVEYSAQQLAEILSNLGFPCEGIEYLPDDAVIDVEVTSNRGDCLGLIGIARELAVVTGRALKLPKVEMATSSKTAAEMVSVEIKEPMLCKRYTARVIEGVKVGASPDWMVKRLEAVGMRSVSNVVDATNYAMIETGQPPHAFDYAKINGAKIIVRKAAAGEQITSIDWSKCELSPDMLVIADTKGPVAVAGVMGGLDSEVDGASTTILLEDAFFDPVTVRTTSRKLALPSEAAFRFGRIVDIENIDWASQRTAQLITQLAGGRVAAGVVDAYPVKHQTKKAMLRFARVKHLLGVEVSPEEITRILAGLGLNPRRTADGVECTAPTWRSDISREADLIEEIARVRGYDKIHTQDKICISVSGVDARYDAIEHIGTYLNGCGYYEAVTVSFVDSAAAELFAAQRGKQLTVKDVTRKTDNILRQSLIGSLLGVIKGNHNVGNASCRVFEIADTFIPAEAGGALPVENPKVAFAFGEAGRAGGDSDFRDIRGTVEGLIRNMAADAEIVLEPAEISWAKAGVNIRVGTAVIGQAGLCSQAVLEKFDFKNAAVCAAELDLNALLGLRRGEAKAKAIARFPAIRRDLSIIVDEGTAWAQIEGVINKSSSAELEELQFVDLYRGKGIPAGKKSVTLSLLFRDADGTLTHEQVDGMEKVIVERLAEAGAVLRTA